MFVIMSHMKKSTGRTGRRGFISFVAVGSLAVTGLLIAPVSAARFQSTDYTIDASVGNSFGGSTSSTDYKMVSSGGEAILGNGASGSYKLGQGYVAQLNKSIELRVQPSSVVAYYPFDENTGTVAHDATPNNAQAILGNAPTWVPGKIGQALNFNGTNQSASIPSAIQNNIETYTISVWVKTTQAPATAVPIVSKWDGSATGYPYSLQLQPTGKVSFAASDGTNSPTVTSAGTVNDGTWHNITAVRTKSSILKLFIDGAVSGSIADNTTASTANNTAIGIAQQTGGTTYFLGSIDEVKLFNKARSDKEVANEYAAENAGNAAAQTFGDLGLGASQTINTLAFVQTDAPSYTLAMQQNQNLTSGTNSIPAVSGTITSPAAWTEGATKGLGFTLTSGPTALPAKWGTSPNYNYAAVPGVSTSFYTRSGYTGGVKDQVAIQYRADVATNQVAGNYQNTITYTATMQP